MIQPLFYSQPIPELPVLDVVSAQEYYRDTFGFEINWLYPTNDVGAVSLGEVALFFRKSEPPFKPVALWIFTKDLDLTYQQLFSNKANIVEPIETKPWGLRQFTVEDQDKNRFYFHQG